MTIGDGIAAAGYAIAIALIVCFLIYTFGWPWSDQ